MVEGYLRAKYGNRYKVFSAGTDITPVHPVAIRVMKEIGIDISRSESKLVDDFFGVEFDTVVTVGDQAKENCPFLPGTRKTLHADFPDPSTITGSPDEILDGFRAVRDSIICWIDGEFGAGEDPVPGNPERTSGKE